MPTVKSERARWANALSENIKILGKAFLAQSTEIKKHRRRDHLSLPIATAGKTIYSPAKYNTATATPVADKINAIHNNTAGGPGKYTARTDLYKLITPRNTESIAVCGIKAKSVVTRPIRQTR